jgi:phospholipase C
MRAIARGRPAALTVLGLTVLGLVEVVVVALVLAGMALAGTVLDALPHRSGSGSTAHRPAGSPGADPSAGTGAAADRDTVTPIHHLVVLFQENVSFDRYFGVYPHALNPPGEPAFAPLPDTPAVNGLTPQLLTHNPNAANPARLPRTHENVCGSNHGYAAEQRAEDGGRVDRFVEETGNHRAGCPQGMVMGYFDGNTVTAMWTYAQHYAMSDNSFGTTYGPSHLGLLNLVSGQTHGVRASAPTPAVIDGTMVVNVEPAYEDCPRSTLSASMSGRNIGDLLNARGISWGFFSGGFRPTSRLRDGTAVCGATGTNRYGMTRKAYDGGDEGFQYYASTANPHHLPPGSVAAIGHADRANHQYDLTDFWAAAERGNLPAVSFLKAPGYQQGGGSSSDPLDEQAYLVDTLNRLQRLASWPDTAVIVMYDDSDGSYDHVMPPIVNASQSAADALTGSGRCGDAAPGLGGYLGRCGHGPRLPFLVISPWSSPDHVDHTMTDQTSVIRFVEDNWRLGRIGDGSFDVLSGPITGMFDFSHRSVSEPLFLDPATGLPVPAVLRARGAADLCVGCQDVRYAAAPRVRAGTRAGTRRDPGVPDPDHAVVAAPPDQGRRRRPAGLPQPARRLPVRAVRADGPPGDRGTSRHSVGHHRAHRRGPGPDLGCRARRGGPADR